MILKLSIILLFLNLTNCVKIPQVYNFEPLNLGIDGPSRGQWAKLELLFGPHFRNVTSHHVQNWMIEMGREGGEIQLELLDCGLCKLGFGALKTILDLKLESLMVEVVVFICSTVLGSILSPDKCRPTIYSYADQVLHIFKNSPHMNPTDICFMFDDHCGPPTIPIYQNWQIFIDQNKPALNPNPEIPSGSPSIKILQFSDLHLDLNYKVGSNARCGSPWGCCTDGDPASPEDTAGVWGHPECQLPLIGLEEIFNHAKNTHQDAKYIFLTGDYIHSAVWAYGKEENSKHVQQVIDSLLAAFPATPIFPVIGNHDVDVCNMFPPPHLFGKYDVSWLYKLILDSLGAQIPADQVDLFLKYGYYSVSPETGMRILAINSSPCYLLNFWHPYYPGDISWQLQWLADQLLLAEIAQEDVYIVGHVSPGQECQAIWSNRFDQIVNRFEGIIRGQFYGHSHKDEFIIAYDNEPEVSRPISVTFVAPAGQPDKGQYSYRTYDMDGARGDDSTWEVMDYQTWTMDVMATNEINIPQWGQSVNSIKEMYQMESLRPDQFDSFLNRMITNTTLVNLYQRVIAKGGRFTPCSETDIECKFSVLCPIVRSDRSNDQHCQRIREQLEMSQA